MTLQARMSENDARFYNPNRDVAHNFAEIYKELGNRLQKGQWPAYNEAMAHFKLTPEDIGQAYKCFGEFINSALDKRGERMHECLQRVGWFDVPEPAHLLVMAIMGTCMTGVYWNGVHEATIGGVGPMLTYADLRRHAALCHELISAPRWKRWYIRLKFRLKDAWRAFHGHQEN